MEGEEGPGEVQGGTKGVEKTGGGGADEREREGGAVEKQDRVEEEGAEMTGATR